MIILGGQKLITIKNGKIYTMSDKIYENGFIVIDNNKIIYIGEDMPDYAASSQIIDAQGGYITPGFIDSHCHIGICEDAVGVDGDDTNEITDPATPHLRAIDAINPSDIAFLDAVKAGVTTVATGPGSANVLGGQFAILKTYGKYLDTMIINPNCAMKVAFGENPKTCYQEKHQSPTTRMATAAILREYLFRAKEYSEKWDDYNKDPEENDKPEFDFKLNSLIPVLRKEIPLKAHAHRADDIITAIRIAKEFDLAITIDHCTEGHLIYEYLQKENISCIIGPSLIDRSKIELKNRTFKTPGILSKNGINVALMTDHPVIPIQYLPICAALSVKEGMDEYDALKAITINPAKILGIDNRVGSLEIGKDADIIIFDRHPFDYLSKTKYVFVNGTIAYQE